MARLLLKLQINHNIITNYIMENCIQWIFDIMKEKDWNKVSEISRNITNIKYSQVYAVLFQLSNQIGHSYSNEVYYFQKNIIQYLFIDIQRLYVCF